MTCIVGLVDKGRVYIGGDSAGVAGYCLSIRADQKVFVKDGFVFGFTSSFRMGQLIRYKFKPPRRHQDDDLMAYMVTEFVDSLRQCFKDGGFARKNSEEEIGGTFLVGVEGRLFEIEGDYQVGERHIAYAAVGCGDDLAMGAMYATEGSTLTANRRITKALEAAERHSAGVCGPFVVESV